MARPQTAVLNYLVALDQAVAPHADGDELHYPLEHIAQACDPELASQFLALRAAGWKYTRAVVSDGGATGADDNPVLDTVIDLREDVQGRGPGRRGRGRVSQRRDHPLLS